MPYGELFYMQLNKPTGKPAFTGRLRAEHSFWLQDRVQYQYTYLADQSTDNFYAYFDPKAGKGMELQLVEILGTYMKIYISQNDYLPESGYC